MNNEMDLIRIMNQVLILYANEKGYQYTLGDLDVDFQLIMPKKDWQSSKFAEPIYDKDPHIPMIRLLFDYKLYYKKEDLPEKMRAKFEEKLVKLEDSDQAPEEGKSNPIKIVVISASSLGEDVQKNHDSSLEEHTEEYVLKVSQFLKSLESSWFNAHSLDTSNAILEAFENLRQIMLEPKPLSDAFSALEKLVDLSTDWSNLKSIKTSKTLKNSIFIGAGVSVSAHLPDWNQMLENLSKQIRDKYLQIQYDASDIEVTRFFRNGYNQSGGLMRYASFLETITNNFLIQKNKPIYFNQMLKIAVYNLSSTNGMVYKKGLDTPSQYPFHYLLLKDAKLLKSIAKMIIKASSTNKLRGVITYNYDDLLDFTLHSLNQKNGFNSIKVEHCHGFLPLRDDNWNPVEDPNIILTDESYMRLLNPIKGSTIDNQEKYLTDSQAWLLGFSLNDIDQRRLLAKVYNKNKNHYAFIFLKRYSLSDNKKPLIRIKRMQIDFDLVQETMLRNLGLRPIWVNDFKDLPSVFEKEFQKFI